MSQRRILLVDTDRAFQRLLTDQLGPYGLEVILASPTDPDVLTKFAQLEPAALVIAVEEPDKVGYALCNKVKKSAAASTPVILVTSTVAAKSFEAHRKTKFHADEYVDKRGLNPAEVVGKIDNLIGLGEAIDELQIPVEIDDLPLDLADAEVVEQLPDENDFNDGRTGLAGPRAVDAMLEADLDGAFAAITDFGDEPAVPQPAPAPRPAPVPVPARPPPTRSKDRSEPPPLPARPETRSSVPLPPVVELDLAAPGTRRGTPGVGVPSPMSSGVPDDFSSSEESIGVPEPIDMRDDFEAEEVAAEWSGEIPEPIDLGDFDTDERTSAGGPPLADMLRAAEAQPVRPHDRRPPPVSAGPVPVPVPEPIAELPFEPEPSIEDPGMQAPVVAAYVPPPEAHHDFELAVEAPAANPEPAPAAESTGFDLGLDEVAARADAEQSGVHDRRTLAKVHNLERDNAKLKAELEKARAAAEQGSKTQGREREFLHLREMIAAKDKEMLELRDELVVKDRQILDGKEKIRTLQHAKMQLEGKNLEMEQRIVGDADRVEAAETVRKELEVQVADVTARLSAVEAKARTDADAATRTLNERSSKATQLDKELTAARTRAGELEREHAETLSSLTRAHDAREAEQRALLERSRDEALEALRTELSTAGAARIAALEAEHADALAARDAAGAAAVVAAEGAAQARLAGLEQRYTDERTSAQAEAEAAMAAERARGTEALETERARAAYALTVERARADQAVSDAATHLEEVTTAEKARSERSVADAQARAQDELVAVVAGHQAEAERLTTEHQRALDEQRTQLESQVAKTRSAAVADHDRLVAEHTAAVAVLTAERDRSFGELGASRAEADQLRADLAALADRARADLSSQTDKSRKDLEAAQRERDQIVASLTTQNDDALSELRAAHGKALAAATSERDRAVETLGTDHDRTLSELIAEHDRALGGLRAERDRVTGELRAELDRVTGELRAEKAQLEQGLSSARATNAQLQESLDAARAATEARERDVEEALGALRQAVDAQAAAVAERDARLTQLRADLDALEQENAGYQEQVLKAYQRIKADESTVTRAKKAMAIALTLLDEEKKTAGGA